MSPFRPPGENIIDSVNQILKRYWGVCTIYKAHPISENLLKYYEEIGHFCLPCDAYDGASRHGFFCDFLEGFEWKIRKIPNSKIYIHLPSSEAQKP